MALQKQAVNIPFGQGLDTKSDPKQVVLGKMLGLQNTVFDKSGLLQKRNGYQQITNLLKSASSLTTFNGGLVAIGQTLQAFSASNNQWLNKGSLPSVDLRVAQVGRTGKSQTTADLAISPSGLQCVAYQDSGGSYYQIVDLATNEVLVAPVLFSSTATMPRAFVLASWFIVTFIDTVSSTPHLQYIAIPLGNLTAPLAAGDISTTVKANPTGYDGVVANNQLYIGWYGSDSGGALRLTYLTNQLIVSSPAIVSTVTPTLVSLTADTSLSSPNIWVMYSDLSNSSATCYSATLVPILASTTILATTTISQLVGAATGGVLSFYAQVTNSYSYDSGIRSDFIRANTLTTGGTLGTSVIIARGLGLASKVFAVSGTNYMVGNYGQASTTSQPSYFIIDSAGNLVCKLAYSNGAGYYSSTVLSNITTYSGSYYFSYLYRDQIVPVNKTQGQTGAVNGIYSQNGVNVAKLTFNTNQYTAEIGGALHVTGGLLWMYDGSNPVEHGFNLWPENVEGTTATTGGAITAQQYFYQFCYEWPDLKGNIHRSAPSIPISINVPVGTSTNANTLNVPTLRLTNKQNVRLVGYRWSTAQPVYYQFTSISSPTLNAKTSDSVTIVDTLADSAILGNTIIYTTGGVIENIGAPACRRVVLYKSRLLLVTAEDRNLIWVSKQVIEGTPVEMSDLLTIYVAPTIASQGSTGDITALSAMDDKIIVYKESAIYYITGTGPDNTGANDDFSDPVFITSTVGCTNQKSIVFSPQGLMFQSNKGIWLLGRDLSSQYIGAEVEAYNGATVNSALNIPTTNQVRFTLSTGITLMYDYYFGQWGTFVNIPGISSTIYSNLHTYLDNNSRVFQETIGTYLDGSNPVLMSFTTAWIKLTNLQGYQRAYYLYLLGTYISPHLLNVQTAYDYDSSIKQNTIISPLNYSAPWGGDALWGSNANWGGMTSVEQWQVHLNRQKCQAIQFKVDEVFDPSLGVAAGAGLTLSGLNIIIGAKDNSPKLAANKSTF